MATRDVTMTLHRGEILGLIGLVGSGRSEIARTLIGADPATSGEVRLAGQPLAARTVATMARLGVVMVPEDRRKPGLVMTLVIIAGGFDLSVAAIFAVGSVSSAWIALHFDPYPGLFLAPLIGLCLGVVNRLVITQLRVNSPLATIATSLIFKGVAVLVSDGRLISVRIDAFIWLGRGSFLGVFNAVWRSVAGVLLLALIANGFNILNADPLLRDLTTGLIILAVIGISASGRPSCAGTISGKSSAGKLVGARGFEPPTPCSRSRCATRLRYAPTGEGWGYRFAPALARGKA